jgi:hypothetical protein
MTVTPYSEGCLERALHAQYVAMMRQMFPRNSLPDVRHNPECRNYSRLHRDHEASLMFMLYMIQRARAVTASEPVRRNLVKSLKLFQEEWLRRIDEAQDVSLRKRTKFEFFYKEKGKWQFDKPRLLELDPASQWLKDAFVISNGFVNKPILTPNSLRNVEEEVEFIHLQVRH